MHYVAGMNNKDQELWLPLPGFSDLYEISSHGRVARAKRAIVDKLGRPYVFARKIRKTHIDVQTGYPRVMLHRNRKRIMVTIHRAVAEAFILSPQGEVVNHKDGNKQNCHVSNLEWCSWSENAKHALDVLGKNHGDLCPWSKVTSHQVREIRRLYLDGVKNQRQLSEEFGVASSQISRIISGKRWARIA